MTVEEIVDYYADLLINQYRTKPKAFTTIEQTVVPFLMPIMGVGQMTDNEGDLMTDNEGDPMYTNAIDTPVGSGLLPSLLSTAFNFPGAVGVQLDIIGKYIGASRKGFTFSAAVTLDDTDFVQLLQIVAARNILKFDLASIQAFVHQFFNGVLQVFDYTNMNMGWAYLVEIGANPIAEFFIKAGLLPQPLTVGSGPIIYAFPQGNKFFGFATTAGMTPSTTRGFCSAASPTAGYFLNTTNVIP